MAKYNTINMKNKPFYKSKTLIVATIMLVLLFVDYYFPNVLPLQQVEQGLDNTILGDNSNHVNGINWGAFFSIISMITLRILSNKGIR